MVLRILGYVYNMFPITYNKNLLIQAKKWAVTLEPKIFQEYNITVANELDFIVEDLFEKWFTDTKQNVVSFNE